MDLISLIASWATDPLPVWTGGGLLILLIGCIIKMFKIIQKQNDRMIGLIEKTTTVIDKNTASYQSFTTMIDIIHRRHEK